MVADSVGLTKRQAECLKFIKTSIEAGTSPTVGELRSWLGARSNSTPHGLLRGLKARGRITWTPGLRRSITLTEPGQTDDLLPPDVRHRLEAYCIANGEAFGKVLADAVTLHLDALAGPVTSA